MTRLFSVFGDSISTFQGVTPPKWRVYYEGAQLEATGVTRAADTWWMQVIERSGGTLLANAAWSGSMVEGGEFPAGSSPERIAALGQNGQAPDDVLVYIGINDYGWGSLEAQVAAASAAAPPRLVQACPHRGREAGLAPGDAAERFAAAYAHMLKLMGEAWPQARLWVATLLPGRLAGASQPTFPYFFRGVPFDAYNDAIRAAVARTPGSLLVDLAAFGFDYEAHDGTHPTRRGMRQIAELFTRGMEFACASSPASTRMPAPTPCPRPGEGAVAAPAPSAARGEDALFGAKMRSARFCSWPCVGCEHARGAGSSWFHVCERQVAR